jgi:hypothetical protein
LAKQVITKLIDDLDGGEAVETVSFAYDGVDYSIDLSARNATRLRKALRPYQDAGVRLGRGPARRQMHGAIEDSPAGRAAIRAWARTEGGFQNCPGRGRIPEEIVEAYRRRRRR